LADYTRLSSRDLSLLLAGFGETVAHFEPIATGFANSSFHVVAGSGRELVLTVLDNHDVESTERLVRLTDWLVEEGVSTPSILRDESGSAVRFHSGHPCVVRPFVEGEQPEHLTQTQIQRVGEAMARYHALDVPPELALPTRRLPENWREVLVDGPESLLGMVQAADVDVRRLPTTSTCLVHGDLFPDNMIWDESGTLHILDWETASIDHPVLDLGFTLVGLTGGAPLTLDIISHLTAGYSPNHDFDFCELATASRYACAVLAFQRYNRHVVRFPNPEKADLWKGLLPFADSLTTLG
jgi:homoserine kinase type II